MTDRAMRFNKGKPKLSYVMDFPEAISMMSDVSEFGAKKYARNNWKKGLAHSEIVDSLLRHLALYNSGEILDEDSGLPHLGHIVWNSMALAEMTNLHPEMNDLHEGI